MCANLSYADSHDLKFDISVPVIPSLHYGFAGVTAGIANNNNYNAILFNKVTTLDFDDFSNETKKLLFNSSQVSCIVIEIIDDNYVERDTRFFRERFQVTLGETAGLKARIDPGRNLTLVYIIDDDST